MTIERHVINYCNNIVAIVGRSSFMRDSLNEENRCTIFSFMSGEKTSNTNITIINNIIIVVVVIIIIKGLFKADVSRKWNKQSAKNATIANNNNNNLPMLLDSADAQL